ncbi:MAG: mechanosensitive ion channel family protein [Acidobacteriia bacterium]|jgi:small conductance mechanosensitive channel|nr:mechanosensitive ion channel family protein [Terriglobia bacterium]
MPFSSELFFTRGLRIAGILVLALVAGRLLRTLTNHLIEHAAAPTRVALLREQQTRTMAGILYSTGTAILATLALLMVLGELGLNLVPVLTAAGLASVAFGLGAQHLVRDLINGFFIVFEDQFVIGDTVRLGDTVGRVEQFTLRRTVLRDAQGALLSVPNGEIRQVANLSRDWSQQFVDVFVPAEVEVDRALGLLEAVAAELRTDQDWVAALLDGPRVLGVESFGPAGVTLRLQVRTVAGRQHDVARELRRRIKARFESEQLPLGTERSADLQTGTYGSS